MDLIGIGEMAHLNCISTRSLRHYQKMGILEPSQINESTGFRYYSIDESRKIDLVQRLQPLGYSLDEIAHICDSGNLEDFLESLKNRMPEIDERIAEAHLAKHIATKLMEEVAEVLDRPKMNVFLKENLPQRHIASFPITNYAPSKNPNDSDLARWEQRMLETKRQMIEQNIPSVLVHNIGSIIPLEGIEKGEPYANRTFVLVDESIQHFFHDTEILPGGPHAVMYLDQAYNENEHDITYEQIISLAEQAKSQGAVFAGDCHVEILSGLPHMLNDYSTVLGKVCIPLG